MSAKFIVDDIQKMDVIKRIRAAAEIVILKIDHETTEENTIPFLFSQAFEALQDQKKIDQTLTVQSKERKKRVRK